MQCLEDKHADRWRDNRETLKLDPKLVFSCPLYTREISSVLIEHKFNEQTQRFDSQTTTFNPFLHIDAFWCLCSRRLFENIVTKEEIAQNEQFLLLPQCFLLLVIGYPFNYRDFLCFDKICSKSSAAELSYEGNRKGLITRFKAFPLVVVDAFWHFCSRYIFENIVAKGETAHDE